MKVVQMNLYDLPFKQIKEGSKTVEVRLNDEKRKSLEIGDFIEFKNIETKETIKKEIENLKIYANFEELYDNYDNVLLGARTFTKEDYVKLMQSIYSKEKEEKYQVLAIKLKCDDLTYRETLISRECPFEGTLLKLRSDKVKLPSGDIGTREWIEHIGACAIVYVDDKDRILLEKQFRYPLGFEALEIPAGKLDSPLENHLECAKREFEEETGLISTDMKYLGEFAVSLAYSTQIVYIFYTNTVKKGKVHFDEDEFLSTFFLSFDEALEMCNDGRIIDSKTIIAINLYNNLVRKNERNV